MWPARPRATPQSMAIYKAMRVGPETKSTSVPPHLQDAHYPGAGKLGHGTGYKYAHDYPNHYVEQQYLPDEVLGEKFYELSDNGYEKQIKEHFKKIKGEA